MQTLAKRLLILVIGGILGIFFLIQLVPYGRDHTNPPVVAEPAWDSPQTRELFFRACGDCQSNQTNWPWYSNLAPISWLVQRDVDLGRAKFNVSEWGLPRSNEREEAVETVQKGSMPPAIYLVTHPEARLSAQELKQLLNGLAQTFGTEAKKSEERGRGEGRR